MQGPDCPRKVPSPPRGSGLPRPQARLILQRHCAPHSPTQGPGDPKWVFTRSCVCREGPTSGGKGQFLPTRGSFQCECLRLVPREPRTQHPQGVSLDNNSQVMKLSLGRAEM